MLRELERYHAWSWLWQQRWTGSLDHIYTTIYYTFKNKPAHSIMYYVSFLSFSDDRWLQRTSWFFFDKYLAFFSYVVDVLPLSILMKLFSFLFMSVHTKYCIRSDRWEAAAYMCITQMHIYQGRNFTIKLCFTQII